MCGAVWKAILDNITYAKFVVTFPARNDDVMSIRCFVVDTIFAVDDLRCRYDVL